MNKLTDDFIDVLNRLLKIDPIATQKMIDDNRIRCDALFKNEFEDIVYYVDKAYSYMSMLGVINTILLKHDNDRVCAKYDENHKIIEFTKYSDK